MENQRFEVHVNQTGYINIGEGGNRGGRGPGTPVPEWTGPSTQNQVGVEWLDDGGVTITFDLVLGGVLENVAPHINGTVTIRPDGKGGYTSSGERDGFPWAEAYSYDKDGQAKTIFQRPAVRGRPVDLFATEADYPKSLKRAIYSLEVWIASPFAERDSWDEGNP
jgi:hypothetical protein